MFKVKVELLGKINSTDKGYIGQFLIILPNGNKDVIKVFSKDASKLQTGEMTLSQNFFFAE